MKKLIVITLGLLCSLNGFAQKDNTLTKKEKKEGWVLLFNGKDFAGWRKCNDSQMAGNWTIDQNAMKVATGAQPGKGGGGDILFGDKKYSNFELSIDWKVEKMGNSGIFYNITEVKGKPIYFAAPEIQVLDNQYATDNKLANHLAGSLYDMLAAEPQNAKPFGEWNNMVIRVKDGAVTHYMNGVKVVEYTLWSDSWKELVAKSKFKTWDGFINGPAKEGFIGLQDHGWAAWYKNIKIKELK